ncbi:MAG TPA: hypothetical protein VHY35_02415 [Stellaceae bacterium]|jgi:hypothetical protein|nr:hypothetical protein [Stellaceae bacterium]
MDVLKLIESAKTECWKIDIDEVGDVPTMLRPGERKMLHYFAKNMDFDGCVVDAGAFCGGSTISLASGLARNSNKTTIHSYDMFVAPNDNYSLRLLGHNRKPGDDVLDIVKENLGEYIRFIEFHQGDFTYKEPPDCAIDLLFIDLAKTWRLNRVIQTKFFGRLRPGRSIVVQQDFNFHGAPWVNILMQYFSDYFERVLDVACSRVFFYKKELPQDLLRIDLERLPTQTKLELIELSALATPHEGAKFTCRQGKAWILFQECGAETACSYLDEIRDQQPWGGASHTDSLKTVFQNLRDLDGYNAYFANFFSRMSSGSASDRSTK